MRSKIVSKLSKTWFSSYIFQLPILTEFNLTLVNGLIDRRLDPMESTYYGGYAIDQLDLGSYDRAVQARIRFRQRLDRSQLRRKNFKRWRSHFDDGKLASSYQRHLDQMMQECGYASLPQLSEACLGVAPLGGSTDSGPSSLSRPRKSAEL